VQYLTRRRPVSFVSNVLMKKDRQFAIRVVITLFGIGPQVSIIQNKARRASK
jgi:hypothetical protein